MSYSYSYAVNTDEEDKKNLELQSLPHTKKFEFTYTYTSSDNLFVDDKSNESVDEEEMKNNSNLLGRVLNLGEKSLPEQEIEQFSILWKTQVGLLISLLPFFSTFMIKTFMPVFAILVIMNISCAVISPFLTKLILKYDDAIMGKTNFYEYIAKQLIQKNFPNSFTEKEKISYLSEIISRTLIENETIKQDFLKWKAIQLIDKMAQERNNPNLKLNNTWLLEQALKETFGKLYVAKQLPEPLRKVHDDFLAQFPNSDKRRLDRKKRLLNGE